MTTEIRYQCSLDNIAKYLPWAIIVLMVGTVVTVILGDPSAVSTSGVIAAIAVPILLIVGVMIPMYVLMPVNVLVNDSAIVIERRKTSSVTIPFSEIISIQRIDNMRFAVRTFGNGGMFGYTGKFYKKGIGSMTWYCTQRKNYVLIETINGKKIVITPDNPDGFMKNVEARYPLLVITPAA